MKGDLGLPPFLPPHATDMKIQIYKPLNSIQMANFATVTENPKNGQVFTLNAKPGKDGKQYGWFRVESMDNTIQNSFLRVNKRSALVTVLASDWEAVKYKAGQQISGRIIHTDSLEAKPGFRPMEFVDKTTGEMKKITSNGMQVYRRTEFSQDANAQDTRLVYDKVAVVAPAPGVVIAE